MRTAVVAHRMDLISLANVPGIEIVAKSSDLVSLRLAESMLCDVVFCDLDSAHQAELHELASNYRKTPLVGFVSEKTPAFRVVDAQNNGFEAFVRKPFDPEDVIVALHQVGNVSVTRGKVICLMGASGGAGVTTITCNLGVQLASIGKTALIDADLSFGGVAQYFDLTPKYTIADVCACERIDQIALNSAMVCTDHEVALLARPNNVSERHQVTSGKATVLLHTAALMYNYVLVDQPRQLDEVAGSLMLRSDLILIVAERNVASVTNARQIRCALLEENFAEECIAIVLNRQTKHSAHSVTEADVEKAAGPIIATIPNDFPAALRASDQGQPIEESSPIFAAIQQLAAKIAGIDEPCGPKESRFRRLLRKAAS